MTLFCEVADHHHTQHASAVDPCFRNPALTVARDFIDNAIMGFVKLWFGSFTRFQPEGHNRKRMRHRDLKIGFPDPRGETVSELELAINELFVSFSAMYAQCQPELQGIHA